MPLTYPMSTDVVVYVDNHQAGTTIFIIVFCLTGHVVGGTRPKRAKEGAWCQRCIAYRCTIAHLPAQRSTFDGVGGPYTR